MTLLLSEIYVLSSENIFAHIYISFKSVKYIIWLCCNVSMDLKSSIMFRTDGASTRFLQQNLQRDSQLPNIGCIIPKSFRNSIQIRAVENRKEMPAANFRERSENTMRCRNENRNTISRAAENIRQERNSILVIFTSSDKRRHCSSLI